MSRVRKTVVKKWLLGRAYGFLVFQGVGISPYRGHYCGFCCVVAASGTGVASARHVGVSYVGVSWLNRLKGSLDDEYD